MTRVLDVIYFLTVVLLSPWILYKSLTTGKYRRGMWSKFTGKVQGYTTPVAGSSDARPTIWFHGVSVGEIHMLRPVVEQMRERHPSWQLVVSTTTDTGFDEAKKRFPDLCVFFWPLDFSWAVKRALATIRPTLVVMAEGELWPNFLRLARRQGVRIGIINGRMSPRSFRNHCRLRLLTSHLFRYLDFCAVQTPAYASCYRALGVPHERISVTGSIKYDGVVMDRQNARTRALAELFGIRSEDLVLVAGSTQDPEEGMAVGIWNLCKKDMPQFRLILVPRQKERFETVAAALTRQQLPFVRRSALQKPLKDRDQIILVDTIGELSAVWGLAHVAFVGGSLDGKRGGQNMIEPAAYGAAVLFGPHVWNFRDTANRLVEGRAAIQVTDEADLSHTIKQLLSQKSMRVELGRRAQELVKSQQGATLRTLEGIEQFLAATRNDAKAA